ncbi:hypothetical protein BDR07DRAFT_713266 [Suillus spraguei]|nr:hypothetical protein BDR07DRAFT_713266 [Suillus spraguei]
MVGLTLKKTFISIVSFQFTIHSIFAIYNAPISYSYNHLGCSDIVKNQNSTNTTVSAMQPSTASTTRPPSTILPAEYQGHFVGNRIIRKLRTKDRDRLVQWMALWENGHGGFQYHTPYEALHINSAQPPVLVVGAGLMGLVAALALLKNSISVRIIDKGHNSRVRQLAPRPGVVMRSGCF